MKAFFKFTLVFTFCFIGCLCLKNTISLKVNLFFYFLSLLGSLLVQLPAIWWWIDYINKVFDDKTKQL